MTGLTDALSASRADDRRRAARALLRNPLLRAKDDRFTLVRQYSRELREWFDRNTGWQLHIDAEVARLVKRAATSDDPTYPARDPRTRQPFGRRRYVLTCLALEALDRGDDQVTLGRLAERVVLNAADPTLTATGIVFTLDSRDERSDLVAIVRLLLDFGILRKVSGDEDAFLKNTGDVLYDVERHVLATMLAAPRGPSTVRAESFESRIEELTRETPPTTNDLQNQRIRHRLTRRLLDDPVLYYDDLDDTERAYLNGQRAALTARITELTGLVAEIRAEGIAMVDPADDLADVKMPETGTEGHATLLIAQRLAEHVGAVFDIETLHAFVREQAIAHKSYWRRNATEPGAEVALTEATLSRLEALRMIYRVDDAVTGLPALARYAVTAPRTAEQQELL
ncbi:TIGR02678 family protein [Prauserella aidingensis]|uniref:TIGR02678 family protein n=1 Tax=Prauserella aidingensis TaxID=387890 RepID=UPI0020A57F2C|nr:TIGR02678 family protein [Prauserella aidingensis]MCP2253522.1 TIGR02678 family protein [Prauserella aidingensis]